MISKQFFLAGRAIVTVDNGNGTHYTYRIKHKPKTERFAEAWFVSVLTGPDNENDFTYLGMLDADTGAVRLTRASKYTADSIPVRVINWFTGLLYAEKQLPTGYTAQHSGSCGRCARTLTTPESIETGIGPECCKKLGIKWGRRV